jgi:hypothetical protein
MTSFSLIVRGAVRWMIRLALPLGAFYVLLAVVGLVPRPSLSSFFCITTPIGRVSGVLGFDFEVSETDCDVIAKDAAVSVFASKPGGMQRILVLKYDPNEPQSMPRITVVDENTIQITVLGTSYVFFQRGDLDGLSIRYNINMTMAKRHEIQKCV